MISFSIENLVRAQFVREYVPLAIGRTVGTRTRLYKLADPFLGFHFRFIHPNRGIIAKNRKGENLFRSIAGPSLHQYYGLAFERLGEASLDRILASLELSLADVLSMGPYFRQPRMRGTGLQIDWLIIRRDGVWNLLEFKYHNKPVGMEAAHDVNEKIHRLNAPSDVTLEPVLISAHGVTKELQQSAIFRHLLGLAELVAT